MLSKQAFGVVVGLMVAATPLGAQTWGDPRVLAMVQRATDRRVQQLADSGLVGYQATAHGYVTFLAQLGEGFRELPRVVKADELALEVYWRAPNLSKQRIVGRRDTTLLPTDIQYHQDHLGIVQNNFPAIIRIGDGDEVRDVPHPLSAVGLSQYEFALSDSLRITLPGRAIDVYEIKVRPRDDKQPRLVGSVYLDRENAQVVRMAFGFTRAAYLDKQLEDVFVVLENGVIGGRFWLPRRQEIEIRRTATWLDYPVRGIIRGRWDIGDYALTEPPATQFFGPEIIVSRPEVLKSHVWPPGRLIDSLPPESRLPTPAEIKRTFDEVRALARARVTQRGRVTLLARGASDFARFDRTGGLALGAGVSARPGRGFVAEMRARYAFDAKRWRGGVSFGWQSISGAGWRAFVFDDVRDAGDVAERSVFVNTLAAQEFGADFTDHYGAMGGGVAVTVPTGRALWTLTVAHEEDRPLQARATPFAGSFASAFDAANKRDVSASGGVDVPTTEWRGVEWKLHGELRFSHVGVDGAICTPSPGFTLCSPTSSVRRGWTQLEAERSLGPAVLAYRAFGGAVGASSYLMSQNLFHLGGPVSAPGFGYHELVGDRALSQTVEARLPVWFPRISLGRYARAPNRAYLAPHWTAVGMHRVDDATEIVRGGVVAAPDPFRATATGWYQSAGVSLITVFDVLRLDASRSLSSGRWRFSIDATRAFWSIM